MKDINNEQSDALNPSEIHNSSFEDLASTQEKVEEKPTDSNTPDKSTTEQPVVEKKVETTPQDTVIEEEFDPEKLKSDLKAAISEEVAQKVVESLTGEKKEKGEKYPWEEEGRTPSYKEALDYVKTKAKEEILNELKTEVAEEEEREKLAKQQQEEEERRTTETFNNMWDNQLAELEQSGRIPKVVDRANKDDAGLKARVELFTIMKEVSDKNIANGKPPITNLKEIFYEHYQTRQVPGANAPIAGAKKTVSTTEEGKFSAQQIHNASIHDILTGKV